MSAFKHLCWAICLAQVLAACTTVESPAPSPPTPRSALEALVGARREKAIALEQQGDLKKALDEWKIALTIDPNDALSLVGKKKSEARLNQAVADALSRGREALKRGVHLEARRHFLTALALDPANKPAFDALQSEIKETRVIQHNVRKGESLASIADFYYADRSRSEVIWEVNQLPPNPKIAPGMVLRIPEIPGVQFRPQGPRGAAPAPETPRAEAPEAVGVDTNPMLDEARNAMEKKEFSLALASVDKFLDQNPRNAEALEIKKTLLYEQGKGFLEQKKYADSYTALNQLAKFSPNYLDSTALLGRARTQLVQQHYSQGLRFYQEEKLQAAITEWRQVLQFDANHQAAQKNIDQAERLLKGLQQRQQKK